MSVPAGGIVHPADDPAVDDGQRRGRILLGLATTMAVKGYRATTIDDIAREARVSKTIVYTHFRSKEHCLLELYSRATDRVIATLEEAQEAARAAGLPWRDRVHAVVSAYLAAMSAGPPVTWAALVEMQAAGPGARALRRRVVDCYVDMIMTLAGELRAEVPDEVREVGRPLVVAAVGGINELMLARVEAGEGARLAEDVNAATEVVVGLLERRG